ncbi:MAG: tRNA (guanosine(46)-N7)-methyltransferase TrmB [Alphaproteobacteria bacterium]|nr:MAG: tRNA (guanosine(46)-N7)-methyltransferase TrmB [Alphaproteobacteria bacterium]
MVFGRRLGRPLSETKKEILAEGNACYGISPEKALEGSLNPSDLFNFTPEKITVEIGFGAGEHLAHQCALAPNEAFFGCEPFINGACSFYQKAKDLNLNNARIFRGDALTLLERFDAASLDKIYILFPDPWPKKKHNKRRLIQEPSLELFHRLLKKSGMLLIATDHVDYAAWIEKRIHNTPFFTWENQSNPQKTFPNWTQTRYQMKAAQQNRGAVFFALKKNDI